MRLIRDYMREVFLHHNFKVHFTANVTTIQDKIENIEKVNEDNDLREIILE